MAMQSLQDLFVHELQDLYDAEHQITMALPKMVKAATSGQLRKAFETHLAETKEEIARLEAVFKLLNKKAKRETCEGMQGLLEEGQETMEEEMPVSLMDVALIAAAQRVEHYEISAYTTACIYARALGLEDIADLLQESLDEETATAEILEQHAIEFADEGSTVHGK